MLKNSTKKIIVLSLATFLVVSVTGCSSNHSESESNKTVSQSGTTVNDSDATSGDLNASTESANEITDATKSGDEAVTELPNLEVRFGEEGEVYTIHLDNNDTAAEIAKDVGSTDWNLPIYHFDDFENSDVMQYYDIADKYTFPSNPETITSEKAGEVYYSDPNRIILFYQDAEVTGEYTKVGNIENTDGLYDAVINNPVLEGWNTKIISINRVK